MTGTSPTRTLEQQRLPLDEFRAAIDTIPGLVWSSRPDGHLDFVNQRWCDYTGLTLDEASGWGWQRAIHPDDRATLVEYWQSTLASGASGASDAVGQAEARLRHVEGHYRWFLFRALPLHDACGRVVKWYGQTTDIDDLKHADAILAGQKFLFERVAQGEPLASLLESLCRLVEAMSDGAICSILFLDADGTRLHHGISPSLPRAYSAMLDGRMIGPHEGPCAVAAYRRETVFFGDLRTDPLPEWYRSVALEHGLFACWSVPVLAASGQVLGAFAMYFREPRTPTQREAAVIAQFSHVAQIAIERTRAEDALTTVRTELARVARIATLGELTASIAHEVNQPLAGIVMNGNACLLWLDGDPPDLERARDSARRTLRDAARAGNVIARLRALFAKEESSRAPVDVNEAIHDVLAISRYEVQRHGATITTELSADLPLVPGDRVQLQQVVLNLIMNAADAVSVVDGARDIVVTTRLETDHQVCVEVRDTGTGFGALDPVQCFNAFFTTKQGGMGMGLSIARSIVESHGGTLSAASNDGAGATCGFTIPVHG